MRLGGLLEAAVEFVVQRLDADSQFLGRAGLVAVVAFERLFDGERFQVAEGHGTEHGPFDGPTGDSIGQVVERDGRVFGEDGGMFHDVGQFAHVAGPGISLKCLDRVGVEQSAGDADRVGQEPAEEVFGQFGYVGESVAQGRDSDLERVDAEPSGPRGTSSSATIASRSRCVAQTTRTSTWNESFSPTRRISPLSSNAEQLGLHGLGQLADFVEKQGAAVGHFKQADAMLVGAGEGASAMAEQFALDEVLRQGAAIDGDERHVGPRALVVDGAGDQLLAGAGFAEDQHGRIGGSDLGDELPNALHGAVCADQLGRAFDPLESPLQARCTCW